MKKKEAEDYRIIQKGKSKNFMVEDFEKSLVNVNEIGI